MAKNYAGEDKQDFFINILGKKLKALFFLLIIFFVEEPKIDNSNAINEIQINAGEVATLYCPATGSPKPQILWFYDSKRVDLNNTQYRLLNGGQQLQINFASSNNTGRYTCIATNIVGSTDLDMFLNVISKLL